MIKAKEKAKSNLTRRKNPDWDSMDRGYRYLTLDMKLPHDQAIALMGNVVEESLGNYKAALKNGGGRGLIQWDGEPAPSTMYGQWAKIWSSVAKPANVYDSKTDTMKNYWAPWNGLKGENVRLKFIKAPLKDKVRIYAESYLRPGKPRINDRVLSAMLLDSIYNPKIMNTLVRKKGGQIIKGQYGFNTSDVDRRSDTTRYSGEGQIPYGASLWAGTNPFLDILEGIGNIGSLDTNQQTHIILPNGNQISIPGMLTGIAPSVSRADKVWNYLLKFARRKGFLDSPAPIPKGFIEGNEITIGLVKLPLTGLTTRKGPKSFNAEAPITNEAEAAAAKDWMYEKGYLYNPNGNPIEINKNTGKPLAKRGRPAGSKNKPKVQPEVKEVETSYTLSGTLSERLRENKQMRISNKGRVSNTDKNSRGMEKQDARAVNSGRSRVRSSLIDTVRRSLSKYPASELRNYEKIRLNLAKKGLTAEEIENHPKIKDFYRYLADTYGYFKLGGKFYFFN